MNRGRTGLEHGDTVLDALIALGGQASTDELASETKLRWLSTLVAAGKLAKANLIVKAEKGNKRGNPLWHLPGYDEGDHLE